MVRRATAVFVTAAAWVLAAAAPALAHGIGGRSDLPLDLSFFLVGGGIVIVASFVALSVLWPSARLQDGPHARPLSAPWLRPVAGLLQVIGLLSLVLVIAAGLFGRDNGARSIVPVMVWVMFWLVVPFASAVVGNIWAPMSPWRTMANATGFGRREDLRLVQQVGVYPAAAAFFAFTWLELVSNDSGSPRTLAIAAVAYTFYALGLASWAGTTTGLQIGEFFTTYARLISAIAPLGRDQDGNLVWRGWLRALPVLPAWKGLTVFVVLMIGTVSYDGLSGTPWWRDQLDALGLEPGVAVGTAGMLVVTGVIGVAYWAASWLAARLAESEMTAREVAASFAHTLVPIALAYAVAHYFTLIIFEGQLLWIQASDPLGLGWDLFGTADWRPVNWLPTTAVWYVQVAAIVGGHILGVVLAHDRALAVFSRRDAVRSQYAMLVLMVLLTGLGLAILAAG